MFNLNHKPNRLSQSQFLLRFNVAAAIITIIKTITTSAYTGTVLIPTSNEVQVENLDSHSQVFLSFFVLMILEDFFFCTMLIVKIQFYYLQIYRYYFKFE